MVVPLVLLLAGPDLARAEDTLVIRREAGALALDLSRAPRNLRENLEAHREQILDLVRRLNRVPGRETGYGPSTAVAILRHFASHRSGLADELLAEFSGWTVPEVRDFVATIRRLKQDPPELVLTSARGEPLVLSGLRGKMILVDVWNLHCEGCIEAMPKLRALYSQYHGRGFEIMGVCALFSPEEEAGARAFMAKHGVVWPNAFVPAKRQRDVLSALGASDGGGQYFLLDQEGRLVSADVSGNWLAYYLDKLLPPSWPVSSALTVDQPRGPLRAGAKIMARLDVSIAPGWHIASLAQAGNGLMPTKVELDPGQPFQIGPVTGPKPDRRYSAAFEREVETYQGTPTFSFPVEVTGDLPAMAELRLRISYQACGEETCALPVTEGVVAILDNR